MNCLQSNVLAMNCAKVRGIEPISAYIESQLAKWEDGHFKHVQKAGVREQIEQTFREILKSM